MSRNFFKREVKPAGEPKEQISWRRRILFALGLPLWVFTAFMLAQLMAVATIQGLRALGVSFELINDAIFETSVGAIVYVLSLLVVMGVPWLVLRNKTTLKELALTAWPTWMNLLFVVVGFVAYMIMSTILLTTADQLLPFVDLNQAQDVGFNGLSARYEYLLAFITLVVIAPVAEEVLFRGYLFGKLKKYVSLTWAVLITSILFGFVHMAWNVGIDTFALSIVLCLMVHISGSLWPAILLHMVKNFVAFYFLFINPSFFSTLIG